MAKTGRPRTPTKLKILRGTFRKDRAPKREPNPRSTKRVPAPPSYLGTVAKAEWRAVAAELHRQGLLTRVDRSVLASYCQMHAREQACGKVVDEMGTTFMTEKGYVVQRPEVAMEQKYAALKKQFAAEFGFTPSSRSRIEVPEQPLDDDPAERFMFGGAKSPTTK